MPNDGYRLELNAQEALRFEPRLILLAAFLATSPLYPPNMQALLLFDGSAAPADALRLSMQGAALVVACAYLLFSARHPSWQGGGSTRRRSISTASSVLYAVSLSAAWISLLVGMREPPAFALFGIVSGTCMIPLVINWISHYLMDFRNVMFYGAIACAASAILAWGVSTLPPLAATSVQIALVVIGCSVFLFPSSNAPTREPSTPQTRSACDKISETNGDAKLAHAFKAFLSVVWIPLLGFLVCTFMMSTYSFDVNGVVTRSEYIGGITASLVVILLCLLRPKTSFALLMNHLVVPLCIAVSIVLGSFPEGSPFFIIGGNLIYVPLLLMVLCALSSLAVMAAAGEFSLPFVFSLAFVLGSIASLLGTFVRAFNIPGTLLGSGLWFLLCVYFSIVVVHLGYSLWKQDSATNDIAEHPQEKEVRPQLPDAPRDSLHIRLDMIAERSSLTRREREILQYLSLGYGSVYISKTLFISDNTARTHIRNIYRKLQINSREALITLINSQDFD